MAFFSLPTLVLFLAWLCLLCSSCAVVPSPEERSASAHRLAEERGFRRLDLAAHPFVLAAFLPRDFVQGRAATLHTLTVYLEGDGLAWRTLSRPSSDPTPVVPVALSLALAQDDGMAVALARPCQYTMESASGECDRRYWTSHRFAPEVIAATDQAISRLKELSGAGSLRLVGYSGGGGVAVLVAAGRDDVQELITVAGNLDHDAWTTLHGVSPLTGSLNPRDVAARLTRLPQRHFVGARDRIIPPGIAEGFLARQGRENCTALFLVEDVDHQQGWAERWPDLLRTALPCAVKSEE